jgi:PAS domain S-box-containing protein
VVIADKFGNIEWVNNSFEKMTGYSIVEVKGKKPGEFLQGPDTNPVTVAYLSRQIKLGEPFSCEILNYNKKKQPYWLRIQGQSLKNSRGEVIKFFAIEEDITAEKESQRKIREPNSFGNLHWKVQEMGFGIIISKLKKYFFLLKIKPYWVMITMMKTMSCFLGCIWCIRKTYTLYVIPINYIRIKN